MLTSGMFQIIMYPHPPRKRSGRKNTRSLVGDDWLALTLYDKRSGKTIPSVEGENKMFNGNKVKQYRQAQNLSQRELAAKIGRSESYVQALEAGTKCESLNAVKLLCTTLCINVNDLFDS
jgi:DNA-binding XRE family transcriptional regulator